MVDLCMYLSIELPWCWRSSYVLHQEPGIATRSGLVPNKINQPGITTNRNRIILAESACRISCTTCPVH